MNEGSAVQRQQASSQQQQQQQQQNQGTITHRGAFSSVFGLILSKILSITTILLRIVLWPLKLLSLFLFPNNEYDGLHTADKAARAFSQKSQQQHNSAVALFEGMGYSKCVAEAHRRNQFLFVYLHSPLHPNSSLFLRMLSEETADGLSVSSVLTDCVKWGGDIHHAEANKVSKDFQVSSYPFCALLVCKSRSSVEVFWRQDGATAAASRSNTSGNVSVSDFCAKIATAIAVFYPIIREEDSRRNHRQEEVRLREEQDREFQQTLLEDQRREAERQAQQDQECQAALQVQREEELVQQRELSRLDNARKLLNPEPAIASTPNIARFRIMFPSGTRIERRFHTTDTIEMIKAFVTLYMHEKSIPISNFQLEMNFPKKVLDHENSTIEQCALGKMAVLMVVDLDA